jgi:hypothetical protein
MKALHKCGWYIALVAVLAFIAQCGYSHNSKTAAWEQADHMRDALDGEIRGRQALEHTLINCQFDLTASKAKLDLVDKWLGIADRRVSVPHRVTVERQLAGK